MNRATLIIAFALASAVAGARADFVKNEVLVKFRPGVSFQKSIAIQSVGGGVAQEIRHIGWTLVRLPDSVSVAGAIRHFKAFETVEGAEPNYIVKLEFNPNDPLFNSQYHPKKIQADLAWDVDQGQPGVVIAVLDTGVKLNHPDLQSKLVAGYDFSDDDSDPSDYDGHGTHTAGTAAAATNNGVGVAGVGFNCRIMPLKIFPNATAVVWINAVKFAADNGAKVTSMSFGHYGAFSQFEQDGINYGWNKGMVFSASAGNNNTDADHFPSDYANVISVGATDANDNKAGFSNFGDKVDVAAPGVDVLATTIDGSYGQSSGTSMSAPIVSGVAGLLFSEGSPTITNVEVVAAIESTTDSVGNWLIHGRVNAFKAIQVAKPPIVVAYPATAISMYFGGLADGGLGHVALSDDNRFQVTSQFSSVGPAAAAEVGLRITDPLQDLVDAQIEIEGKSSLVGTNMFWLYNWQSGSYDYYRALPYKTTDTTSTFSITPRSKYLSANGEVQVITRVHRPTRMRPLVNFTYGIDRIRLIGVFRP